MKVGDIVKWYSEGHDPNGVFTDNGLIVQVSRSGAGSARHALVLFENGDLKWIPSAGLEVINESR